MITIDLDKAIYLPAEDKKVGIILFHAYTGSTRDMNLLAHRLNRLGYSVLAPQFAGHGTKDIKDVLKFSPNYWRQEAHAYYEWMLAQGYENLFVFGLSMGGIMAADLVTEQDYRGIGGGSFNSPVLTREPIDISEAFMGLGHLLANLRHEAELFEEERQEIEDGHWQQMKELEAIKNQICEKLDQATTPYFLAQSGMDELINPRDAFLYKDALINTQVDFHYYPENTHSITTNRNREQFETDLFNFLEQVLNQ